MPGPPDLAASSRGTAALQPAFADDVSAIAGIDAVPRILEVVCRTTGMGFAAVARVTEDRWIACAVRDEIAFGLEPGGELDVTTTICNEIRQSDRMVVIDHVAKDRDFCDHATPKRYGFQSYISVPVRHAGGRFFGTLCAIDPRPARLQRPEVINMFTLFADLIGFHLDARERVAESERALVDERQVGELREQFIAVLGHDLRNPLAAIRAGAAVLSALPLDDRAARVAAVIGKSAHRMSALVDNVLDFARGRLGGGLPTRREPVGDLVRTLEDVTAEFVAAWPDRTIERAFSVSGPIQCDLDRVAQMLSNLLANALVYGDAAAPVSVRAHSDDGGFELSVTNAGEPIAPELVPRLFLPFTRASAGADQPGLGLGLYIASEIARAHDGTLAVTSTPGLVCFTFRMPATVPTTSPSTA